MAVVFLNRNKICNLTIMITEKQILYISRNQNILFSCNTNFSSNPHSQAVFARASHEGGKKHLVVYKNRATTFLW